ncbi:MAG: hypothetical protein WC223_03900 [Bacteroidales bacterium]
MKKKTIQIIFITTLSFYYNNASSQIGLQLSYIKPSGLYGYYFKPSLGTELFYKFHDYEEKFNMGLSLGFYKPKPRLDTFPDYNIQYSNGTYTLLPGYMIYKNYFFISIGIISEYKFLDTKLTPLVGLDVNVNMHNFDYENYIETAKDIGYSGEQVEIAIVPRIGIKYELEKTWVFSAGIGKSMGYVSNNSKQSYWKPYISVCYYYQ